MCCRKFFYRADAHPPPSSICLVYTLVFSYVWSTCPAHRAYWSAQGSKHTESSLSSTLIIRKNAPNTPFHSLVGARRKRVAPTLADYTPNKIAVKQSLSLGALNTSLRVLSDVSQSLWPCHVGTCCVMCGTILTTNRNSASP